VKAKQRLSQVFAAIAPDDSPHENALPLALLVRPLPMLTVALLAINDHGLKGSGLLPAWLTGKLSDFAGLFFFPLLLVSLYDLLATLLFRWVPKSPLRPFPTPWQVGLAIVATGTFFAGVQLHPDIAHFYARTAAFLMFWQDAPYVRVTMDPTDTAALLMLPLVWLYARKRLAAIPPLRLAWIRARLHGEAEGSARETFARDALADVRNAAVTEKKRVVDRLGVALAQGADDDALAKLLLELRA
jgi:hypothetical protein